MLIHHLPQIISNLKFDKINQIQEETIKAYNMHDNVQLIAPTGSGKTVAFLLASLQHIKEKEGVQVLILAPTRELVLQIESVAKEMKLPFKTNACYGGHPFSVERKNFSNPPTLLIGTPGRIEDHLNRETFNADHINQVIFDEFDKSLEFGFSKQMEAIMYQLKQVKRIILVSATNSIEIPDYIPFNNAKVIESTEKIESRLTLKKHVVKKDEKLEGLRNLLNQLGTDQNAIAFVNHRETCDRIADHLDDFGITYSVFHGGMEQVHRELALTKFRNGSSQVLLATDIAARGIDVPELNMVIHYQLPPQESTFIHRNGRTARVEETGTSVLLMTKEDYLPDYIDEKPEDIRLRYDVEIMPPTFDTLYIGKGKKDKINKMDIVGFCYSFDFMEKGDVGMIEVKDFCAYVAIKRTKMDKLIKSSRKKKIKNKTAKIQLAR
jgi:superfamily II DNA/RNA helicase